MVRFKRLLREDRNKRTGREGSSAMDWDEVMHGIGGYVISAASLTHRMHIDMDGEKGSMERERA